jgi:allantoin racemase
MMRAVRIKYVIPFPFGEEGLANRAAGIPRGALRPDTVVDVVPVRNSFSLEHPSAGSSYYESMLLEMYVIEAALSAEDEGYDAVVMDSTSDSGIQVLRSRLSIPVVGPGSAAAAVALLLGKRFSFIVYEEGHRYVVEKIVETHHLSERCASIRSAGLQPDFETLLGSDPEEEIAHLVEAARRAVEEDGADTIVLGSTTMHQAGERMQAELGVPVVNPAPAALALAELLVSLGLSHSKRAYPSPAILQDEKFHSLMGTEGG